MREVIITLPEDGDWEYRATRAALLKLAEKVNEIIREINRIEERKKK